MELKVAELILVVNLCLLPFQLERSIFQLKKERYVISYLMYEQNP